MGIKILETSNIRVDNLYGYGYFRIFEFSPPRSPFVSPPLFVPLFAHRSRFHARASEAFGARTAPVLAGDQRERTNLLPSFPLYSTCAFRQVVITTIVGATRTAT